MPFNFTRLIWVSVIGYLAFAEVPSPWAWAGGAIIMASASYLALFERRRDLIALVLGVPITGGLAVLAAFAAAGALPELFDGLAERFANFEWHVALSDPHPADDWRGPAGFIHQVVYDAYLKDHHAPEDCEYYLCGPPVMISAVLATLERLGVEPPSIFYDDFGA